ncbi:MAG: hypothetical protein WC998_08200, partial [Candidatus Paceibacterota bacterium]
TNFNTEKARKIEQINKDGQKYKADKENFLNELNALKEKEKTLQTQIEEFNVKIQTAEEDRPALVAIEIIITADRSWKELKSQIDIKEAELLEVPKLDVSALLEDKSVIIKALDELKAKLSIKEVIEIQLSRKEELLKQEKSMSQELASLEGLEYTIFQFEKAKIDNIEEQINSRFKMAKFRLFKTLINNSVEMCCDTLYKGVPYNSLNAAARIQVGIDIINVLSEHYGVRGVLYIDNRESTTEIPETNSQVVNLYVSPEHKELTIK